MNTFSEKQINSALRNGRKVTVIVPSRNYALSNNGGAYEYGEAYTYRHGVVTVQYWTSCDFASYCPNCGAFTSHNEWDNCAPRSMSLGEAVKHILSRQGMSLGVDVDGDEIHEYVVIEGM